MEAWDSTNGWGQRARRIEDSDSTGRGGPNRTARLRHVKLEDGGTRRGRTPLSTAGNEHIDHIERGRLAALVLVA